MTGSKPTMRANRCHSSQAPSSLRSVARAAPFSELAERASARRSSCAGFAVPRSGEAIQRAARWAEA
eukprot:110840-Pleurochrysis_carterae.AAC.1